MTFRECSDQGRVQSHAMNTSCALTTIIFALIDELRKRCKSFHPRFFYLCSISVSSARCYGDTRVEINLRFPRKPVEWHPAQLLMSVYLREHTVWLQALEPKSLVLATIRAKDPGNSNGLRDS